MLCIPSYQASPGIWHTPPSPCHLTLCHKSIHPVILSQTLEQWALQVIGLGFPACRGSPLRDSMTNPITMKAASPQLSSPQLFTWEGRKDHLGCLPRAIQIQRKESVSQRKQEALWTIVIFCSDTRTDRQGRRKSRQTAKRPLMKYHLKLSIHTRSIHGGSKHTKAKSSYELSELAEIPKYNSASFLPSLKDIRDPENCLSPSQYNESLKTYFDGL